MTNQYAIIDQNRTSGALLHSGTDNSAETIRQVGGADGGVSVTGLHGVPKITAVTVANGTATALPGTTLTNRKTFFAYNSGSVTVWLGGTEVTASNTGGIPVGTSEYSPVIDLGTAVLYAIAGTIGGTLTIMEVS